MNSVLRANDGGPRISERKVGGLLTSLGLTDRPRTNTGCKVTLDRKAREDIHELVRAHGVDNKTGGVAAAFSHRCDFCVDWDME